jgi:hypothetical protein
MENFKFPGTIKCIDVQEQEDGSAKVIFEADDEFKEGFKQYHGLKKWSQKKFDEFLQDAINNMARLSKEESNAEKKENTGSADN